MENLMSGVSAASMASNFSQYDKTSMSRRSVDYRDSGIIIDEDQLFNSYDPIDFEHKSNLQPSLPTIEPDVDGDTILHLAVVGFTLGQVKDLIKICDLNAINNMMQTPLHIATLTNRLEVVQLLLASGAKLNIHDRRGNTPLHVACQKGFKEIASAILDSIQDELSRKQYLELNNFEGQSLLHLAASHNHRRLIELLVEKYNANINCQDSRSGGTILHKAISKFDTDLVAFILSLNKHCNQADYSGRRPLHSVKIMRDSRMDSNCANKLDQIGKMIEERIEHCIEQNGCCKDNQNHNEILETSSSSSDYSDSDGGSDYDMS